MAKFNNGTLWQGPDILFLLKMEGVPLGCALDYDVNLMVLEDSSYHRPAPCVVFEVSYASTARH